MLNRQTLIEMIAGPAGTLECAVDQPEGPALGLMVIAHPLPLQGGTMDNKVVHTLARAGLQKSLRTVRFNFRGVGQSTGAWDEGRGEIDDLLAVIQHFSQGPNGALEGTLLIAGFSFGAYVAAQAYNRLLADTAAPGLALAGLILIAPAVSRYALGAVPGDTLVIHGECDEVVALAKVFDWARPQTLALVVMPGVGHFFHGQLALLKQLVVRHLSSLHLELDSTL